MKHGLKKEMKSILACECLNLICIVIMIKISPLWNHYIWNLSNILDKFFFCLVNFATFIDCEAKNASVSKYFSWNHEDLGQSRLLVCHDLVRYSFDRPWWSGSFSEVSVVVSRCVRIDCFLTQSVNCHL